MDIATERMIDEAIHALTMLDNKHWSCVIARRRECYRIVIVNGTLDDLFRPTRPDMWASSERETLAQAVEEIREMIKGDIKKRMDHLLACLSALR